MGTCGKQMATPRTRGLIGTTRSKSDTRTSRPTDGVAGPTYPAAPPRCPKPAAGGLLSAWTVTIPVDTAELCTTAIPPFSCKGSPADPAAPPLVRFVRAYACDTNNTSSGPVPSRLGRALPWAERVGPCPTAYHIT